MAGLLFGPRRALLGGLNLEPIFRFDPLLTTFTPNMDKRAAPGPFATAPIIQGDLAVTTGDALTASRGDQIHDYFYANTATYQGSIAFWITPEWDGDDGRAHRIFRNSQVFIRKEIDGYLELSFKNDVAEVAVEVDVSGWTAGTTYFVVCRWDIRNALDGTNYACISINNVHTFDISSPIIMGIPSSAVRIGQETGLNNTLNAIIEGLTVYRRPLFDGTNGIAANWDDSGPIDEIEEIYAAGAGEDPCLITGSWDAVFCLPTNSTAEALVTGTGEAWSHPHASGVLQHQWLEDGGYLGRPWAVLFNGTTTNINCGSGATLDNLADNILTAEAWIRLDGIGEGNQGVIVDKSGNSTVGWRLYHSPNGIVAIVYCAGTDAVSQTGEEEIAPDGKWHHVVVFFDDAGDRKAHIAVDGVWVSTYDVQTAGVGVIDVDAAEDLFIGNNSVTARTFDGVIGWCAISDNDRYSHGTDFIPPRQPPATDGNHVEMWHVDEGTGALINAEVTSPANDGTLSNGTWEEQWDQETSPIVPRTIEFDGDTEIDHGSDATLDDLPSGAEITVEIWIRANDVESGCYLLEKTNGFSTGWGFSLDDNGNILFATQNADTDVYTRTNIGSLIDGKWHHLVMYYDDTGDRKGYIAVDGIWVTSYTNQVAGIGAYQSDAAQSLDVGYLQNNYALIGAIGWYRISDNDRYSHEVDFTPISRANPPGSDGNTVLLCLLNEGAGTTIDNAQGDANRDGILTPATGGWRNTPDMEIDSPGERIFNWGYVMGNDAVDEGIVETLSGLDAGENYVVRTVASIESASRGRPKIIIYDETNGAQITSLEGPSYTGTHDGLANAATLTDTTARFPQMLVGWTIYNITDGSSATITAISGDMQVITGALSGGTDDDWDIGDEYRIVPPGGPGYYDDYPWIETFTFELPTSARNGVAADCVSISVKLVNGVNNGVIKWHQIELLENLMDNPSLETGAGNPWIPDGWTNNGLDAGDTETEAVILHSGVGSMEWNVGAVEGEDIRQLPSISADKFVCAGLWSYGDNTAVVRIRLSSGVVIHSDPTVTTVGMNIDAIWLENIGVARCTDASPRFMLEARNGAVGDRFADDYYVFELDDVSLTVTPASEVNSAESGGLRVDGRDVCTQPIPAGILTDTSGWIKFRYIPRHGHGIQSTFNSSVIPTIVLIRFDGTRYIWIRHTTDNNIDVLFNDGGGNHSGNFNTAGIMNADQEYLFEIIYSATEMILKIDGVIRRTLAQPINFTAIPNIAYWGQYSGGTKQNVDAVFKAP